MKNIFLKVTYILFLCFISNKIYAQIDNSDYIILEDNIWYLNKEGKINTYDLKYEHKIENYITNSDTICQITKDIKDNPIILDNKNYIKRYNFEKKDWDKIYELVEKPFGIIFDNDNNCYTISGKGITDLKNNKTYFSNQSLNHQIHYTKSWSRRKPSFFIDKRNNIWIGFGYGEWGGDIFIFDTVNKNFVVPNLGDFSIELSPIKTFFEDNENVYLSSGLAHMMTSGCIVKLNNFKASYLFKSETEWENTNGNSNVRNYKEAEYIGPATYNKYNNSIYFYSQNGIFKGEINQDLSKLENWKSIIKPKLNWRDGQTDAVGSPMNVLKIDCIDNEKFVILTQNDGIGYFNGKKLILIE